MLGVTLGLVCATFPVCTAALGTVETAIETDGACTVATA
jgi:hypothetical protein